MSGIDQNLPIFLWFCGGFVLTFVLLLFGTFVRSSSVLRWLCVIGAFCGLIYEGGCFATASSFGKATGGGEIDGSLENILAIAFLITVIWCAVILVRPVEKRPGKSSDEAGEPPDI